MALAASALLYGAQGATAADEAKVRSWSSWWYEARKLSERGDLAGANEAYAKAVETAKSPSEDPAEVEKNVSEVARLLLAWGRFDQACEVYGELATGAAKRHGARSVEVLAVLRPQITACSRTAEREKVGDDIDRYLEILEERASGMSPEERDEALFGMLDGIWQAQAVDLLLPRGQRVLELGVALLPEGGERVAVLHERMGAAYLVQQVHDPDRAIEILEVARARWEALEGEVSMGRARVLMALAAARYSKSEIEASEELSLEAVATLEKLGPEGERMLVGALFELGRLYLRTGRQADADAIQKRIDVLTAKLEAEAQAERARRSSSPAKGEIPTIVSRGITERQARDDLMSGRFADLDEREKRFREERVKDESGTYLIHDFHAGLLPPENADLGGFWQMNLQRIKDWQKERPDSLPAVIAEGDYWLRYGWRVRGTSLAKDVGETEMEVFEQHLEKSWSVLEGLGERGKASPRWYRLMLTVARGLGRPDEVHRKLFEDGITRFPDDVELYVQRGMYLLPQWYGSWDSVAALADWSADPTRGGPAMYARYYWGLFGGLKRKHEVFDPGKASWERMEKSFRAILAEYPSPWNYHALAYFACVAKDRGVAGETFEKIGDEGPYSLWGRRRFDECRAWALEGR